MTSAANSTGKSYSGLGNSFLFRGIDGGAVIVIAVILIAAVAVPLLSLLPDSDPLQVSPFLLSLTGKYLCYAILALSVGLVWGYAGILSLGHAAFFALGGYAMGMYLMRQIGSRGSYGNPILPDFMVFLNWQELPWFWYGFDQFWFAMIWVVLAPGLLAFVFGWFAFRSRVTGVYLSIITQAMTYALWLAFFRNDTGFGGNNGMTDFKDILGYPVQSGSTRAVLFACSALALALSYFLCRAVISSKYGKVLVAVRDSESRTRFLGYRAENYKVFAFALSACMAGIGGALYVPQVGIINPSEFEAANSIEAVVWVAVGGRGTLIGPILGAIIVSGLKTFFTGGSFAAYWQIAILPILAVAVLAWNRRADGLRRSPLIGAAVAAALVAVGWLIPGEIGRWWPAGIVGIAALVWVVLIKNPVAAGALLGASAAALLHTPTATIALAPYWLFFLGAIFIGVTLFFPRGIVGSIRGGWSAFRERRQSAAEEEGVDAGPPGPPPSSAPVAANSPGTLNAPGAPNAPGPALAAPSPAQ